MLPPPALFQGVSMFPVNVGFFALTKEFYKLFVYCVNLCLCEQKREHLESIMHSWHGCSWEAELSPVPSMRAAAHPHSPNPIPALEHIILLPAVPGHRGESLPLPWAT